MTFMSGDLQSALAKDRADRLLAEAESHRRATAARPPRAGAKDRLTNSIDQGWSAIKSSFEIDRRPRIAAN